MVIDSQGENWKYWLFGSINLKDYWEIMKEVGFDIDDILERNLKGLLIGAYLILLPLVIALFDHANFSILIEKSGKLNILYIIV